MARTSREWAEYWLGWAEDKYAAAQERFAYSSSRNSETMDKYQALASTIERGISSYKADEDSVAEAIWCNYTKQHPASGYYCQNCGRLLGTERKDVDRFCPRCGSALKVVGS